MGRAKTYRVGYLNPWKNAAENQAYHSMASAAAKAGHSLVHVSTTTEIEAADLDFVIATASTQPKTTSVPTFGSIHEPRERFWQSPAYFDNLLSYDGYLTISDSLERFLRSLLAGYRREAVIGRYYNTPQQSEFTCPVERIVTRRQLGLCYFGTNWDRRGRSMFRELAKRNYMRIYGPEASWSYIKGSAYKGSPPFDGNSVQLEYAAFGAGLVALSQEHLLDDVISNRIFEIASVGAVAICPDMPWIRRNFGDSVFYYDAAGATSAAIAGIDTAMASIAADPANASRMAASARAIFEQNFAAEVMLANAVRTFESWQEKRTTSPVNGPDQPLIDVIVRCGGRDLDIVERALRSIDQQQAGRFRVILVRYKSLDLKPLQVSRRRKIEQIEVVDCLGGNRSATLCAGLSAVRSPYFAVLDDDDYWLDNHIETLLAAIAEGDPARSYAHSGTIAFSTDLGDADEETHTIHNARPCSGDIWQIMGHFAMNSFLCSSDLLQRLSLDDWRLETAEDSVLQASLIAHADVFFTQRPSACFQRNSENSSDFINSPQRRDDEFDCFTRIASLIPSIERKFAQTGMSPWDRLGWSISRIKEARRQAAIKAMKVLVLKEGQIGDSLHDLDLCGARAIPLAPERCILADRSHCSSDGEVVIQPDTAPWAYGLQIELGDDVRADLEGWIVLEFQPSEESFGVGILDHSGNILQREECPASNLPTELWLKLAAGQCSRLLVQNWSTPLSAPITLTGLYVVEELDG